MGNKLAVLQPCCEAEYLASWETETVPESLRRLGDIDCSMNQPDYDIRPAHELDGDYEERTYQLEPTNFPSMAIQWSDENVETAGGEMLDGDHSQTNSLSREFVWSQRRCRVLNGGGMPEWPQGCFSDVKVDERDAFEIKRDHLLAEKSEGVLVTTHASAVHYIPTPRVAEAPRLADTTRDETVIQPIAQLKSPNDLDEI